MPLLSSSTNKNRPYDTITFAAPVLLGGKRGNIAVVVRQQEVNYYKVHRILMPDGTNFTLDEKRDTAETAGVVYKNSSLSPTDNVSINSIPNYYEIVNSTHNLLCLLLLYY